MERRTFIWLIIITCLGLIHMAGCATNADIENILREQRWNELDAAVKSYVEYNIKTEHKVEVESNIKWAADFLKQYNSCNHIPSLNTDESDSCYRKSLDIWRKISGLPFSRPFNDDLRSKANFAWARLKEIQQKKSEEEKLQHDRETALAEQRQKELGWEQVADNLRRDMSEKVSETPAYITQGSACIICGYIVEKKRLEEAIEDEKSYSNKYGVVNLSKIDRDKQYIIQIDQLMADKKKIYKKQTGNSFDTSQCSAIKLETCDDQLSRLQKEITSRLIAEQVNLILEQDRKNYIRDYIGSKQSPD